MRGDWNHVEPNVTQERPEDNTGRFINEQVRIWEATGTLIHPESAMEIAAWYHGPNWPGLTAFSHYGKITNTLVGEIERDLVRFDARHEQAELKALLDYVRTAMGKAPDAEELMKVVWIPNQRSYRVGARSSSQSEWSIFEGNESELDSLLSLARDVMTGG